MVSILADHYVGNGSFGRQCIAFGGLRVDDAIEQALLQVVEPGAIEAALKAQMKAKERRDQVREALCRDPEVACYEVDRAFRQYNAIDPENRLVVGELEKRWNTALIRQAEIEKQVAAHDANIETAQNTSPVSFVGLADDLQTVWNALTTNSRLKKRIVRTVNPKAYVIIALMFTQFLGQTVEDWI